MHVYLYAHDVGKEAAAALGGTFQALQIPCVCVCVCVCVVAWRLWWFFRNGSQATSHQRGLRSTRTIVARGLENSSPLAKKS